MAATIANGMTPEQRLRWSQEQVYIALGNAVNGAYSLGLGTLPDTVVPTAMVSVGYSAEPGSRKLRHPVDDILV